MTTPPALRFDPIAEAHRQWEASGWGDCATGMTAVTSVMRVHQLFVGSADALLARFGVTFARYEVLMLLAFSRRGSLPLGKIGARLQVHAASVTNAINRLERDGLVTREPDPIDGRRTLAHLTTAGRQRAMRASRVLNEQLFSQLPLSERELGELVGLLRTVRREAGDFR
jgi:DNA-binding MarR family transcriptional regulator